MWSGQAVILRRLPHNSEESVVLFVNICSEVWCLWLLPALFTHMDWGINLIRPYIAIILFRERMTKTTDGIIFLSAMPSHRQDCHEEVHLEYKHLTPYCVIRERTEKERAVVLYFWSQEYIQNPQIHLSNVIQFSRENQFCDLDSSKQNAVHALAQCKAAINFALRETESTASH